jgi:nucleotide-binding universal stress UspA family protein
MKFALRLARHASLVTAVHVVDPFQYRYGAPKSINVRREQAWTQAHHSMALWLQKGKFCDCEKTIIEGDPAPAIAKYVATRTADIVVLATSARRRASRVLFGSVAEEILRDVCCPVFVLGPKCSFSKTGKLSRLVFATDLEPHSLAALSMISKLSKRFRSTLWAVRAVSGNAASPAERRKMRKETQERLGEVADRDLRKRIKKIHVVFAPPVKAITSFANRIRASAIVMGIRRGGELTRAATHIPWAIVHRVIAEARCPVLTIRG